MSMNPRPQAKRRVSRAGLELIKSFEGLRRKAARLPGGRHVLGYGHIRSAREGAEVDAADAEALLRYDLLPIEAAINDWAMAPLNQNQFDALVSFTFNIGLSAFRRSEVLRRINEGDLLRAAAAMDVWRRVDLDGDPVIVDALVRRRAVEKALFLTPPQGQVPAPSGVLKPRIDTGAFDAVPVSRPETLQTPLDGDTATVARSEPEPAPEPAFQLESEPAEPEPELELVITETVILMPEPALEEEPEPEPEAASDGRPAWTLEPDAQPESETSQADGADLAPELDFEPESPGEFGFEPDSAMVPEAGRDGGADAGPEAPPETAPETAPEALPGEASTSEPQGFAFDHDEDEDQDEGLSAAQAAAAAVAARLSEILAQDLRPDFDDEDDLAALAEDPDPDTADGVFLQAPPSPPEEEESRAPSALPDLDHDAVLAFAAETPQSEAAFEPEAASASELQPFPEDLPLPPVIEPEEQADFDSAFAFDPEFEDAVEAPAGETWDKRSGALPSAGDPGALAAPLEENNRAGLLIFLGLGGLTFVIAALVSFARTPLPGAEAGGSAWTLLLGTVGVLLICGALWFALGGEAEAEAEDGDGVGGGASEA